VLKDWDKTLSSHEITHLIHEYGLIVIFLAAGLQSIGFPIPGGTALVAGGIDASTKHGLPLVGVIVVGALGALVGTTIGYALGSWRGDRVLLRLGKLVRQKPERVQQLREWFQNHAVAPLFIARFITGLRNVAGLVAGSSGVRLSRFLVISGLAALAWSALITLEYYFVGRTILGAPTWLQIVLVIVGIVGTIFSLRYLGQGTGLPAKNPAQTAERPERGTAVEGDAA
jgi:membrane protein DedA with SNARE-associated domain